MTAVPPTRLRADARRNRDKIIRVAVGAFVDDGPYLPMEEIARLAGVGVGTLYRHFPDRGALIVAVVQDSLATMLARARVAEAEETHAWDALVRSLSGSRELRLTWRLPDLFLSATGAAVLADPTIRRIRDELTSLIDSLVRAAQEEGSLRPDVGTGDVIHLFSLLLRGPHRMPGEVAEAAYERARGVILDGLRARPGISLTGRALSVSELDAE
ncbi:TetR/AcrR family transcriptional regulator [Frankia sp. Mgl5]|uniref:TetR/AcrR family transcriptional regulator n=1 Tax=Frankia sp. Mgl5 TaxID=2933793 RepID=UPI00200E291B|nr:TetR/AcrR family transcriptional regulator [Frankia sp. Mgl5]MCK9926356.1 TetR/AcrR family transcriptional regulator [Frankia sp. Mgl5]